MSDGWEIKEHWQVVNAGGSVISTTPQQLWNQACEYFKWVDDNPIEIKRTITVGKDAGKQYKVQYKRPYNLKALCLHCGISERYMLDIKETKEQSSEWYMVMEKIMYVIYSEVLEGALVDIYNPIMASKMLNMDKDTGESDKPPRVEIVESESNKLANSENEVLEKLDFEKVNLLKDKLQKP